MITDRELFAKLERSRQKTLARLMALPEGERGRKAALVPMLQAAKPIQRLQADLPPYEPRFGNPMHYYTPKYRPPMMGTVPAGFQMVEAPQGFGFERSPFPRSAQYRYGVIAYTRPLSDDEMKQYELDYASPNPRRSGNPLVFSTSRGEMSEAQMMEAAREAAERREISPDYRHASTAARWLDSAGVIRLEGAKLMREKNPPMLVLGNPGRRRKNAPMLVLGNPKSGPADSTAAEELELYITNDADLYRQQFWPIVKNLMHRQMKGDFDFEKSVKLWGYFVDNGAKKYIEEHGSPGQKIDSMFNKNTRLIVARSLAQSFVTEAEYGNYDIPAEGLRWGRGGNPAIHSMGDSSWKKATKAHRIQWLKNKIAFVRAHPAQTGVTEWYLHRYEKALARIQGRGGNPHLEGDECQFCGGPLMYLGTLGSLEHYRCRNCGAQFNAEVDTGAQSEVWPNPRRKKPKNPWAICTTAVGRKNKKKYERCVKKVKGKMRGKNPNGLPAHIANDPQFKAELAAFHKRHGNIPVRVMPVNVPKGYPKYMSAYGEAPEAKYDAPRGSKKGKRFHIFGKKGKGRPHLVSSVEKGPKFLAYVGGKFKAKTDWLYD